MKLELRGSPNGLGPAAPHLRTCVDPRVPDLDRARLAREVQLHDPPRPQPVPCRCGALILFAESPSGATIPLDLQTRIDWIREDQGELVAAPMPFDLAGGASGIGPAISHFRSCPKASEFARGGRRR